MGSEGRLLMGPRQLGRGRGPVPPGMPRGMRPVGAGLRPTIGGDIAPEATVAPSWMSSLMRADGDDNFAQPVLCSSKTTVASEATVKPLEAVGNQSARELPEAKSSVPPSAKPNKTESQEPEAESTRSGGVEGWGILMFCMP